MSAVVNNLETDRRVRVNFEGTKNQSVTHAFTVERSLLPGGRLLRALKWADARHYHFLTTKILIIQCWDSQSGFRALIRSEPGLF